MTASARRRVLRGGVLAVLVALVVLTVALVRHENTYVVHARFANAGQLIKGNLVEVGGIAVGEITALTLTPDGLADVELRIDDPRYRPLREGTTAGIGTVGAASITNRFIALTPAGEGRELRDGAVLPIGRTRPIVDIDAVLNAFTPKVRASIRSGLQDGVDVLHNNVTNTRRTLTYADSALSRTGAFARALTEDRRAFSGLLRSGATLARTLHARESDLQQGIRRTGDWTSALATRRASLQQTLAVAPPALGEATRLLRELRPTLAALAPFLRDSRPVAAPLARVLRSFVPTARRLTPALARFDASLPSTRRALDGLPALAKTAVPKLNSARTALERVTPILAGLRPYSEDILLYNLRGIGGNTGFNYDANGHFARLALGNTGSTTFTGVFGANLEALGSGGLKLKQYEKCPGSAVEPMRDGSAPLTPEPLTCDPRQIPGGTGK